MGGGETLQRSDMERNDMVWSWLTKNKVYVRTKNLSQSQHVNIGWVIYSHPEYVNQALATKYLQCRMEIKTAEFELLPHCISHTTADGGGSQ